MITIYSIYYIKVHINIKSAIKIFVVNLTSKYLIMFVKKCDFLLFAEYLRAFCLHKYHYINVYLNKNIIFYL